MHVFLLFGATVVLASANAEASVLAGIIGDLAALESSIGDLERLLPTSPAYSMSSGTFLPIATSPHFLPFMFGLKTLALVKTKKMLTQSPLLLALKLQMEAAQWKRNLAIGTKLRSIKAARKATAGAVNLPMEVTAVKLGALSEALAGAKASLDGHGNQPKESSLKTVPVGTLLSEIWDRVTTIPMWESSVKNTSEVPDAPVDTEEEIEEPAYGAKF